MDEQIGIGVVGTGFGVRVQIPVFASLPGVRVVSVCSGSAERAQRVAERFDIPHATTEVSELAALADVDLVSIATRPDLHHPGVLAALEAGKHVLCEKPFTLNASQARELLERARERGVLHLLNFEFRTTPARVEMRRLIQDGYLGALRHVHMLSLSNFLETVEGNFSPWWFETERGGGWLGASCSHDIDALRCLFGEIVEVSAKLETVVPERRVRGRSEPMRVEVDDTCFLLLRFANGAVGALLSGASVATAGGTSGRLEAHGSEGSLLLAGGRLLGARKGEAELKELPVATPDATVAFDDPHYIPFGTYAQQIAEAVRTGEPLAPDFEDGLRNQLVIDAARRSAAEGRWVATGA